MKCRLLEQEKLFQISRCNKPLGNRQNLPKLEPADILTGLWEILSKVWITGNRLIHCTEKKGMCFSFTSVPENSAWLPEDSRASYCGSSSVCLCVGLLTVSGRSDSAALQCQRASAAPVQRGGLCSRSNAKLKYSKYAYMTLPYMAEPQDLFIKGKYLLHFPIAINKSLSS